MPQCRDNWRRRKARRRKRFQISAQKVLSRVRLRSGARPYYEAYALHARPVGKPLKRRGGLPRGGWRVTWKERLSADGRWLYRDLMKMCAGVTVKLPPSVLAEVYGKKS